MLCPECKEGQIDPFVAGAGIGCPICGWTRGEYVPSPRKTITHPRDIEWFTEYSAPVMENLQRMHFTLVNSTIPFFGPMLYLLARQIGAEQICEIGTAEGYTSFYLANAVKDNGVRFGATNNHFYGVDIVQVESTRNKLLFEKLPVTILEQDSLTLTKDTFPGVMFGIIFIDGCHDEEHVVYEFKTLWPQVKGKGEGYMIFHDAEGPAWEGCRAVKKILKEGDTPYEVFNIGGPYGLMLVRNMANFDYEKNPWA